MVNGEQPHRTSSVSFIETVDLQVNVKVLQCPQCGSADIHYEAGLITGQKYRCKKCGYVGAFVIEKDVPEP